MAATRVDIRGLWMSINRIGSYCYGMELLGTRTFVFAVHSVKESSFGLEHGLHHLKCLVEVLR